MLSIDSLVLKQMYEVGTIILLNIKLYYTATTITTWFWWTESQTTGIENTEIVPHKYPN